MEEKPILGSAQDHNMSEQLPIAVYHPSIGFLKFGEYENRVMGDSSQIWDPTQNFLHPTIAREEGSEEVHSVMDHTKTISMLTAGGE
jgi:hypothetical protein